MVIDMATIERRGDIGGFVSSIPPEDQFVHWRSERDADLIVSLASLAGERLFFDGDNSAGVGGDMRSATAIAALMLGHWSMGDTVASHGVSKLAIVGGSAGTAEDGTDRNFLETELGKRVEEKLQAMLEVTTELLRENRTQILAVAHALETHRTVSGDDIEAIIDGRAGPAGGRQAVPGCGVRRGVEQYHEAALEAHREHAGVDLSMPGPRARRRPMPQPERPRERPRSRPPPELPQRPDIGAGLTRRAATVRRSLPGILGRPCASTTRSPANSTRSGPSSRATSRCTPAAPPCTAPRISGTSARTCSRDSASAARSSWRATGSRWS